MTNDIVDACTDTLRKALVIERSRDTAMIKGVFMNQAVDILSRHASLYLVCNKIKGSIGNLATLADARHLLRRLYQVAAGHQVTAGLPVEDYLVHLCERLAVRHNPVSLYLTWHISVVISAGCGRPPWGCSQAPAYLLYKVS